MKRFATVLCTLVLFAFATSIVSAADINLYDFAYNIDGTFYEASLGDSLPAGFNASGLGTIMFTITGAGSHNIDLFLDYEVDEAKNTFFNEYGDTSGTLAAGQSWEIDEPGFIFGDIYDNTELSTLDGTNAVPFASPDDVSFALGWDFTLASEDTSTVKFITSLTQPVSGFYLSQFDPDSDITIYFSSTLDTGEVPPIPEPGTWILMLTGLALTGGIAAKRSKRS
ncbi:MAG: PEP-CTERM sorting domain-containing protein [Acidobacteria bacterium]|nr:PEP-CTERM sorting domain-containing protein [Acidobacteriota bacterium]